MYENNHVPSTHDVTTKIFIPKHYIPLITVFLLICATFTGLYIVFEKVDNLECKIIGTIINNTNVVSNTKLSTTPIKDSLFVLQENSTTHKNDHYFTIINRTEWEAANATGQLNRLNGPVGVVIIAHTDTLECENFISCKYQMKMLQLFYIQLRNFEDIGYNFLIGGDGAVYQGIGWDSIGCHTRGHSDTSIGIGFIGNYQNNTPTENQLSAATLLLNYGLENNYLDRNYIVKGQRDLLPTVSPGINVYNRIKAWGHFFQK